MNQAAQLREVIEEKRRRLVAHLNEMHETSFNLINEAHETALKLVHKMYDAQISALDSIAHSLDSGDDLPEMLGVPPVIMPPPIVESPSVPVEIPSSNNVEGRTVPVMPSPPVIPPEAMSPEHVRHNIREVFRGMGEPMRVDEIERGYASLTGMFVVPPRHVIEQILDEWFEDKLVERAHTTRKVRGQDVTVFYYQLLKDPKDPNPRPYTPIRAALVQRLERHRRERVVAAHNSLRGDDAT